MTEPSHDLATNGRVLVVDDDAALAEMLSIVLRQEGFDSFTVSRGDLALDALREIDRLLGQLSSNARAAFLHNRLDGMGHAEIAERLGVSVSRVRQYLAQGLRQCYIALYGEPQ